MRAQNILRVSNLNVAVATNDLLFMRKKKCCRTWKLLQHQKKKKNFIHHASELSELFLSDKNFSSFFLYIWVAYNEGTFSLCEIFRMEIVTLELSCNVLLILSRRERFTSTYCTSKVNRDTLAHARCMYNVVLGWSH